MLLIGSGERVKESLASRGKAAMLLIWHIPYRAVFLASQIEFQWCSENPNPEFLFLLHYVFVSTSNNSHVLLALCLSSTHFGLPGLPGPEAAWAAFVLCLLLFLQSHPAWDTTRLAGLLRANTQFGMFLFLGNIPDGQVYPDPLNSSAKHLKPL